MNQQDKQLLLADLCARLPYGVKFKLTDIGIFNMDAEYGVNPKAYKPMNMTNFYHCSTDPRFEVEEDSGYGVGEIEIDEFVPILFPLSSVAQEITIAGEMFIPMEKLFCEEGFTTKLEFDTFYIHATMTDDEDPKSDEVDHWLWFDETSNFPLWVIEKLNQWHIDYRSLIGKGLAVSVYSLDKNPYE